MKSVWGKLSSNASAAFSVVQDAYDGVAKDFRGLNLAGPANTSGVDPLEKDGELLSRDELSAWSPSTGSGVQQAVRPSTFAGTSLNNPWATTRNQSSIPSVLLENPWYTERIIPPSQATSQDTRNSGLPADPTIAQPVPKRAQTLDYGAASFIEPRTFSRSSNAASSTATHTNTMVTDVSSQPFSANDHQGETDPLGVGLL